MQGPAVFIHETHKCFICMITLEQFNVEIFLNITYYTLGSSLASLPSLWRRSQAFDLSGAEGLFYQGRLAMKSYFQKVRLDLELQFHQLQTKLLPYVRKVAGFLRSRKKEQVGISFYMYLHYVYTYFICTMYIQNIPSLDQYKSTSTKFLNFGKRANGREPVMKYFVLGEIMHSRLLLDV